MELAIIIIQALVILYLIFDKIRSNKRNKIYSNIKNYRIFHRLLVKYITVETKTGKLEKFLMTSRGTFDKSIEKWTAEYEKASGNKIELDEFGYLKNDENNMNSLPQYIYSQL
ncbi:hypothetical protein LPB90_18320 [Chryseobacterium sp. LC2016-29]|uniref:hypothetical protein n=1 Tax=Chryseobacterium sp. LC2016-29 TaxID=2897331 RepID=UPI001E3835CE|nr:hypothetical protein [Chryseobacterium sp. LC2016-29]MCD0480398.1 hypothetical protein [Chryseobacterium sp. LC2016-29]